MKPDFILPHTPGPFITCLKDGTTLLVGESLENGVLYERIGNQLLATRRENGTITYRTIQRYTNEEN